MSDNQPVQIAALDKLAPGLDIQNSKILLFTGGDEREYIQQGTNNGFSKLLIERLISVINKEGLIHHVSIP